MLKIIAMGAERLELTLEEHTIEFYPWSQIKSITTLRDYDICIFALDELGDIKRDDWLHFNKIMNFSTAKDILLNKGAIFIIGDPRFRIPDFEHGDRNFLDWTRLAFEWIDETGTTKLKSGNCHDDKYEQFLSYIGRISGWNYCLRKIHYSPAELSDMKLVPEPLRAHYDSSAAVEPICENRYGGKIIFEVSYGIRERDSKHHSKSGPMIFLPTSSVSSSIAINFVLRDLLGIALELQEPTWLSKMILPGQKEIDNEIASLMEEKGDIISNIALLESKRKVLRSCLRLLFDGGPSLEAIVKSVLCHLGGEVQEPSERGKEDGWLSYQSGETKLEWVLEIKSTARDQFSEDSLRQLAEWQSRGKIIKIKEYKGLLIGNSGIRKPLEERPNPFSDSFTKSAVLFKFCILRAEDLYKVYIQDLRHGIDRAEFWKAIYETEGIFSVDSFLSGPPD